MKTWFKAGLAHAGYCSKPTFLVIGAQKSGTSAIYNYLSRHPSVVPPRTKEIHFFDKDKHYNRGISWYHSHFPLPYELGQHAITFEATPRYLYHPATAERIFSYAPQMQFVILLRNPIDRAFSSWNMFRQFRDATSTFHDLAEYREFDEAVRDEINKILSGDSTLEPSYVRRGLYYVQLLRYFEYFRRSQFFIIDSSSLKGNRSLVLNRLIELLGLPEYDWYKVELPLVHVRSYEEAMSAKTRDVLREFYEPYNQKLYELLGRDFGWQ